MACLHLENALKEMDQLKVRAQDNNEITPGATVRRTATSIVTPNKQLHAKRIINGLQITIICSYHHRPIIAVDQSEDE